MRKPHEQKWAVAALDSRVIENEEGLVVADVRARMSEDGRQTAALIASAPDMARALLIAYEQMAADGHATAFGGQGTKQYRAVSDALRKAGVLS